MEPRLIKKGAEADIYLIDWYGKTAISKKRSPKSYRHKSLDDEVRKYRTIHEAQIMSQAKLAGIRSPYIYFVDPSAGEIIMEFVRGENLKDALSERLCFKMGRYAALLHSNDIIHGDLTTSNFLKGKEFVLLDFGLAYYSGRIEDRAVDIRLVKEVLGSAHVSIYDQALTSFIRGYTSAMGKENTSAVLENVSDIERRGRYARFQV